MSAVLPAKDKGRRNQFSIWDSNAFMAWPKLSPSICDVSGCIWIPKYFVESLHHIRGNAHSHCRVLGVRGKMMDLFQLIFNPEYKPNLMISRSNDSRLICGCLIYKIISLAYSDMSSGPVLNCSPLCR